MAYGSFNKKLQRYYSFSEEGWKKAIDDYGDCVLQALCSSDKQEREAHQVKAVYALTSAFMIERALKRDGILDTTADEQLSFKLDSQFGTPDDRKPRKYKGKLYVCKQIPLLRHPVTKQVLFWDRLWLCISDEDGSAMAARLLCSH